MLAYLSFTGIRLVLRVLTHVDTFLARSREELARAKHSQSIIADLLYNLQQCVPERRPCIRRSWQIYIQV